MTLIDTEELPVAFDEAAPRYDLMVALNPGYHRHLRDAADSLLRPGDGARGDDGTVRLADLGCGSGASTRALLRAAADAGLHADITGVDSSGGMLDQARAKTWPPRVAFAQGLAEDLAVERDQLGLSEPVAGVLAAYLFRNVVERDKVLAAVHDLLGDGGTLVVQEYSVAGSRPAQAIWTAVCWSVVIPLAWLTSSRQTRLYRYLWRSVQSFDSVQSFVDRLYGAGFTDVEVRTVSGWQHGILHTFRARKLVVDPVGDPS